MTEIILKLLGARVDDAVNISDSSLAFRGGISWGWFAFWLIVFAAAAAFLYRQSPFQLSRGRKYTLAILRILFLALLLVLLLRPILALTVEGTVRRSLLVLVDSSASMQIKDTRVDGADQKRAAIAKGIADPAKGLNQNVDPARLREGENVSRLDITKSVLQNARLNLLPALDKEFDLEPFTFGQGVAGVGVRKQGQTNASARANVTVADFPWVDQLAATNPVTALGDAMRELANRKRGQPLAGVWVLTDGANNSGTPPRELTALFKQEGVPLYIYGVGITSPRDLIIGNIFAPDVTFVKDEVQVTVRVRAQGLAGETANVALKLGGQTVASRAVAFQNEVEQAVALRFTPQTAGDFDLEASVDPRPDEAVKDNNSRTHRLRIIDAKIKVLLVDQSPRWEFRYLQAMLLRDRRVDLKCLLIEGDPGIARGNDTPYIPQFPAKKEELFKFDLVIFGDVDPKALSAAHLQNLHQLVSDFGGAFVMVAGKRFAPTAYKRTPFEKMLPVDFDAPALDSARDTLADKPVKLELTSAGRSSLMLRLSDKDDENVALWKELPPVYWVARVLRPKPAAEVLLVDPDPAKESRFGKMPVIAHHQYGLGQVMFVGTDNTWRWRKNVGDMYYTALWGQIAQRVSLPRLLGGSKQTQLTSDRQNYMTGDRISIFARLYVGFEPVQEPSIKGIVGLKSGEGTRTEVTLRPMPEQAGVYRAEFVAGAPGAWQFFIEQDPNTPLDYTVTEPKFEFGETAMNEALLKELATLTGGTYFREEDLHKLPQTISAKTERVKSPLEVELWSSPLYFILMVGVVSAEWLLRKWSHLK